MDVAFTNRGGRTGCRFFASIRSPAASIDNGEASKNGGNDEDDNNDDDDKEQGKVPEQKAQIHEDNDPKFASSNPKYSDAL